MTENQIYKYLNRIGINDKPPATLQGLQQLIHGHLTNIPFENLSVFCEHKTPSLAVDDIYQKVVIEGRGGYCYELNSLFFNLLKALGFDAYPIAIRLLRHDNFEPTVCHRATIVRIGGALYLADVGYGGSGPKGALMLSYTPQVVRGECFVTSVPHEGYVQIDKKTDKGFKTMFVFDNTPAKECDFIMPNFYFSQCCDNPFRQMAMLSICTETGTVDLHGNQLIVTENGKQKERTIGNPIELQSALRNIFKLSNIAALKL